MDEDDLKWIENEKNTLLLLKQLHGIFRPESSRCRELKYSSGMQHDAWMHLECVNPLTAKLFNRNFHPLEVVSR